VGHFAAERGRSAATTHIALQGTEIPVTAAYFRRTRNGCLAVLVAAAACTTWRPATDPTRALARRPTVPRARIVLRDGRRLMLDRPVRQGDSIVGTVRRAGGVHTAVPVDSVARLERAEYSVARSLGLVAGIAAGAWLTFVAIFMLSVGPNY
jgi:hypothetical protein